MHYAQSERTMQTEPSYPQTRTGVVYNPAPTRTPIQYVIRCGWQQQFGMEWFNSWQVPEPNVRRLDKVARLSLTGQGGD